MFLNVQEIIKLCLLLEKEEGKKVAYLSKDLMGKKKQVKYKGFTLEPRN